MEDKKINCLNYVISDSYIGKKSKIEDDIFVQTQKMLDKKVKKELKQTLKHTKDLLTVDSSTLTGMQKDDHDSLLESGLDSVASSSLQSSQKPKGSKMGGSQEKSGTKEKHTSPNSSFAQNSKNSETQISKVNSEPVVNNQKFVKLLMKNYLKQLFIH